MMISMDTEVFYKIQLHSKLGIGGKFLPSYKVHLTVKC